MGIDGGGCCFDHDLVLNVRFTAVVYLRFAKLLSQVDVFRIAFKANWRKRFSIIVWSNDAGVHPFQEGPGERKQRPNHGENLHL